MVSLETRAERIKHLRKLHRLSQERFAEMLGVQRGAVGNWELGKGIKTENLTLISDRLGVPLDWLAHNRGTAPAEPGHLSNKERGMPQSVIGTFDPSEDDDVPRTVRVVGYVGAGAEGHFYAVAQGDLDEVPAPEGSTESTRALEIRGISLGTLFDRWMVFYDDVRSPVTSDLLNRLCVVGLPDDRVLVKRVQRAKSRQHGLYDLISNETEPPITDVAIEWAAKVKNMVPR